MVMCLSVFWFVLVVLIRLCLVLVMMFWCRCISRCWVSWLVRWLWWFVCWLMVVFVVLVVE